MTETLDANKTELTHKAVATVAAWLDNLGCKPVETEVPVDDGWILDVASFWTPTLTEARQAKLLQALVPPDIKKDSLESLEWLKRSCGGRVTIGVEVKTSRADFLKDAGRKYGTNTKNATLPPCAHLLVLACPASVLQNDFLQHWAVLRLSENCERVVKFDRQWYANPQHPHQIETLIASVAIRRDHATRYQSMRRFLKSYRAEKIRNKRLRKEAP